MSKKEKKELLRRYGRLAESMEPYYHHLDLRPLTEMDDTAFAYIMRKVKGVNMLDLNETQVTNESIRLLTGLEYVNELRAKGCHQLDDGCIESLNELTSLVFLHLKGTMITIDGLLRLKNLVNLRELIFSAGKQEVSVEQMRRLKMILPSCSFAIDGKPWHDDH